MFKKCTPLLSTIWIFDERIRTYGRAGDFYDQILNKLMDAVDGKRRRNSVIITEMSMLLNENTQRLEWYRQINE
jgi:hypothetical protein